MKPPLIGITLDYETNSSYAAHPWYALRENYFSSVTNAGGIPIALPHELSAVNHYLSLIDGVMITGGNFDIDPSFYGDSEKHPTVTTKDKRTAFEWKITEGALALKKPILGICGGEQLLNVVLGGSLIQHIPDTINKALEHEQKHSRSEPGHTITISPGSLLNRITTKTTMQVNTSHHQAVKKPGKNVDVTALAEDGVIEAIEYPAHPFCLGVQWHPEYGVDEGDHSIMKAFIEACKSNKK